MDKQIKKTEIDSLKKYNAVIFTEDDEDKGVALLVLFDDGEKPDHSKQINAIVKKIKEIIPHKNIEINCKLFDQCIFALGGEHAWFEFLGENFVDKLRKIKSLLNGNGTPSSRADYFIEFIQSMLENKNKGYILCISEQTPDKC